MAGEIVGEFQNVRRALAQRRQLQVHHIEAEEQILAEGPLPHAFRQIPVGRGNDTDIHRHRPRSTHAVDHPFLNGAQELGLQAHIHLGNLVQQQRAAIGFLELADPAGNGPGKGALLMAEKLGFQQVLGNRRAIDGDERLARTRRAAVHMAGNDFLACAGFAGDQDRSIGRCHLFRQLHHGGHGFIAVDQVAALFRHGRQNRRNHVRIRRQRDIFLGAGPDGGHSCAGIRIRPAGNDRHMNALVRKPCNQRADVQLHLDHQQIGATAGAQHPQRPFDVIRMGDLSAALHRDFRGCRKLAAKRPNNQQAHLRLLPALSGRS